MLDLAPPSPARIAFRLSAAERDALLSLPLDRFITARHRHLRILTDLALAKDADRLVQRDKLARADFALTDLGEQVRALLVATQPEEGSLP